MNNIKVENNATNVQVRTEDTEYGTRVIIEPMPELVKLSEIKLGEKFKVGDYVFRAIDATTNTENWEISNQGYILENFFEDGTEYEFGDTNNYAESKIRKLLNGRFYEALVGIVGEDNIIQHSVDLTSRDGLKDYGSCRDMVSLITERMYQDNREYLPNAGKYWWLATPFSTESNGYSCYVCIVSGDGTLDYYDCVSDYTVRPFCIFNPSLLVSKYDG